MISDDERRVLEELERCFDGDDVLDVDGDPPERRPARAVDPRTRRRRTLAVAAFAGCVCLVLVITGAALSGFALLVATGLVGVLWHYWPRLRNQSIDVAPASPRRGKVS